MAKDCTSDSKTKSFKGKKVLFLLRENKSLSPVLLIFPKAKVREQEEQSLLEERTKVMKNLHLRALVLEGGFKAELNVLIHHIGLVYLKGKFKETNIFLLFDSNSLINTGCAKHMELKVETTKQSVKVIFTQRSGWAT